MKIWCLLRDQYAHVAPVEAAFGGGAQFVCDADWNPADVLRATPDLVLCVNDYPCRIAQCLDAARQAGIPSLVIQDGILEWRCQYENPLFGAGGGAPQHQPVLADKIACIGHQSFVQIAAWGNGSKVELAGMPRLDALFRRRIQPPQRPGRRLLIMTAKNPGFTPRQREITLASLRDVKICIERWPGLEVKWRISRALAQELGVANELCHPGTEELLGNLAACDAVITTPSTAMLEAMAAGRPVAALDYHNVPRFVGTAWMITAPSQIEDTLAELLNPPASRLHFQSVCLHQNLVCDSGAAQRVRLLIERMVACVRARGPGVVRRGFAPQILCEPCRVAGTALPPLAAFYPGWSVFEEEDVNRLQVRLARAENENRRLRDENATLGARIRFGGAVKRRVQRWLQTHAPGARNV